MAPDEERPGEDPAKPSTAPKRRLGVDFIHEVVSLPATTLSDDDQKAEDHQKAIVELILTGDIGSLLRAFRTDAWTASSVIVDHVWSSDPDWVAIAPTLAPALASLLEEQGQAAEGQAPAEASALEQEPFVRLCIAKTLACITRDPEALDILLREAAAFGDKARDLMRSALGFFKPLEVMPNLIRFLRRACGSNQAAWQVFFASIVYLIDVGFGAYEDRPADAERCLDMTLSLFAEILGTDERLDEWVEEDVVRLVRTRATPLAGGLKPVVAKLGGGSGDAANRIAWRVYRGVLMGTESNLANRETAAEWVTRHPSEVSEFGGPSAWRVYVNIIRYCREFREWEYRLKAARDLGEYGPTSTRDPLPEDVKEVRDFLEDQSKTADDPDLRKVAIAALAQNRARGEETAQETRISICAMAAESPAVLSSECIIHFVEPPRLLIHHNLTVLPSPGETFPVSRMDASQGVSLDLTATRSPDLDLASVSFTTTDPAVQSARVLLVREPGDGLFQLDIFEHGRKVIERIEQRRQPTAEDVQQYLNRLRDFDFSAFSIERKHEVAKIANRLIDASGLDVFVPDPKQDGRLTRITRVTCFVPNERSKGSFQARVGRITAYTGKTWPELIVQKSD